MIGGIGVESSSKGENDESNLQLGGLELGWGAGRTSLAVWCVEWCTECLPQIFGRSRECMLTVLIQYQTCKCKTKLVADEDSMSFC